MAYRKYKKIAKERIDRLFQEAEVSAKKGYLERADRYVELARKIGMKYNVTLPSKYTRRICKNCYSYLYPGKTCRVRVRENMIVTKCDKCGNINRFVYKNLKKGENL